MEYRIEIIKDRREMMDWLEVVESLLVRMGTYAVGKSCGYGYDVFVTIDDMHDWISRAIDHYGQMKIVKDSDDKLTIVLGYEVL